MRLNGNQVVGVNDLKKAGFLGVQVDLVADNELQANIPETPPPFEFQPNTSGTKL